ncbi:hypothetical protein Tco_0936670 [Tanacetum coccineum]|uniref:Uncharacterized protein n=1 Tax=Tanacetum coccineum TaxID=301880 RepID=A0ABQ5DCY3_9ASTR
MALATTDRGPSCMLHDPSCISRITYSAWSGPTHLSHGFRNDRWYQISTKGQKQSQKRQNRARNGKSAKKSKSKSTKVKVNTEKSKSKTKPESKKS